MKVVGVLLDDDHESVHAEHRMRRHVCLGWATLDGLVEVDVSLPNLVQVERKTRVNVEHALVDVGDYALVVGWSLWPTVLRFVFAHRGRVQASRQHGFLLENL